MQKHSFASSTALQTGFTTILPKKKKKDQLAQNFIMLLRISTNNDDFLFPLVIKATKWKLCFWPKGEERSCFQSFVLPNHSPLEPPNHQITIRSFFGTPVCSAHNFFKKPINGYMHIANMEVLAMGGACNGLLQEGMIRQWEIQYQPAATQLLDSSNKNWC